MTVQPERPTAHRLLLEQRADRWLEALVPYTDSSGALILLPGATAPRRGTVGRASRPIRLLQADLQVRAKTPEGRRRRASNGLEGFARSALLGAYRAKHASSQRRDEILSRVHRGLVSGTAHGPLGMWPDPTDNSQSVVEAGLLAMVLHHSRQWLWDEMPLAEQDRVERWLLRAAAAETPKNNWLMFGVLVERFLRSVGRRHDQARTAARLAAVEEMYRGEGWYSDGGRRNFDYYCGWGFHTDLIESAGMLGDAGRTELQRHRERLHEYLEQARHLVERDGRPVAFGRSLSYRHAVLAPFWSGVLVDATPLPAGGTREVTSALFDEFESAGVPDARGLLRLGWVPGQDVDIQTYSGASSPYWAAKAYAGLLLSPEHPEWHVTSAPQDRRERITMPVPALVALTSATDGLIRVVNHGLGHDSPVFPGQRPADAGYDAFAYSSRTVPPPAHRGRASLLVNQLLVRDEHGEVDLRRCVEPVGTQSPSAPRSRHTALSRTIEVTSLLLPDGWEVRVAHLLDGEALAAVEAGGFGLTGKTSRHSASRSASVVGGGSLESSIHGLSGWDDARALQGHRSARSRRLTTPVIRRARPWQRGEALVWLVGLHADRRRADVMASLGEVRCDVEGMSVAVSYGRVSFVVDSAGAVEDGRAEEKA